MYYERALAMVESLYPKDRYPQGHPDLAGSLNNLGALLQAQGSYVEAGELRACPGDAPVAVPEGPLPPGPPPSGHQPEQPGGPCSGPRAPTARRGYFERALAMRQSLYPKDRYPQGHPDLASSLNNLGGLLFAQGSYGEAGGTTSVRWRCTSRCTRRTATPRATPIWPEA